MKIVETVFDCCFVMEPFLREDNRGVMEVLCRRREQDRALFAFMPYGSDQEAPNEG